jgi:hypothetical protein
MPDPRGPRNNPVSDIERFLMEVDRLRKKAAEETQRGQRRRRDEEVMEVEPVPEALPAPPPVRRSPPPPRPQSRQRQFDDVEVVDVAPARQPAGKRGAAPPTQNAQGFPTDTMGTVKTVPTIARPAEVATIVAPKAAGQLSRLAVNLVAEQVRSLLKPTNIRATMLLREILDPPLCKRRRQ